LGKYPVIYVDKLELRSKIPSLLEERGADIVIKKLDVADYQIGSEWGFERKRIDDLSSSIIKKRIFKQIYELVSVFIHPVIIIEGDIEKIRRLNKEAFWGFIGYLLSYQNLKIIWTPSQLDTAILLLTVARQNLYGVKEPTSFYKRKAHDEYEEVMRIIHSFPGVGAKRATILREVFGSIYNIINADREAMKEVLGKRGEYLHELFRKEYF